MRVHGEVLQVHGALSVDGQPEDAERLQCSRLLLQTQITGCLCESSPSLSIRGHFNVTTRLFQAKVAADAHNHRW